MKSTDFASRDMYKQSSHSKKMRNKISAVFKRSIINADINLAGKQEGRVPLFDSTHMNQFVHNSQFGVNSSLSLTKDDKTKVYQNEFATIASTKDHSLAFRLVSRNHPGLKKQCQRVQYFEPKVNPLIPLTDQECE